MAFDSVNEDTVYSCTGQPLPTDITVIMETMLSHSFDDAYKSTYTIEY